MTTKRYIQHMLHINFSHSDTILPEIIQAHYPVHQLQKILETALTILLKEQEQGLVFPYFINVDNIQEKDFELDIYLTDSDEARTINNQARDKNYATNILSYRSDLPADVINMLPSIILGELIICHEVISKQAEEQQKSVEKHVTHLFIHGLLHLLGFDHELGEAERLEMESFEIEILHSLNIANPYIS